MHILYHHTLVVFTVLRAIFCAMVHAEKHKSRTFLPNRIVRPQTGQSTSKRAFLGARVASASTTHQLFLQRPKADLIVRACYHLYG
jgi:hypothetical protein